MDGRQRPKGLTMACRLMVMLIMPLVSWSAPESCPAETTFIEVESSSDIMVGAVLDIHEPGLGVYGCGKPSEEGIHYYESLRWAIQVLNQDSGYLKGKPITESFIPGVKIGLRVYDSCSHSDQSVQCMTEMFPVLKSGGNGCEAVEENATKIIGIIDATGTSNIPKVATPINKYLVPVIPLDEGTTVPAEQLAKALAEVVHDTDWEKVAVLHADDEYSVYVTKVFGQISFSGYPCITSMKSFPDSSKSNQFPSIRKVISSVTSKLTDKTGVIVVGQKESIKEVLEVIKDSPELSRLQWLFSWLPPTEELGGSLDVAQMKQVYSLSPYPKRIDAFETYWAKLQDIASVSNREDLWFMEYAMSKKNCRAIGFQNQGFANTVSCENLIVKESPMQSLMRTSRFLPAFHAVFTFANAYKKAWVDKCHSLTGMCQELKMIARSEFVEKYLEPLEFDHGRDSRSPEEVHGQKNNHSSRGEIDGLQMALNVYSFTSSNGLDFRQVFAYDNQEAKVIDDSFRHVPSSCPKGQCTNCISVRQSRLDTSGDYDISSTEDFVSLARSEDVLIPILLAIHKYGTNSMECGTSINLEAVQNLEAALWTIDQINSDPEYLQGVRLGAVVIDTCSSPLTLTQRLSNFLIEMQRKSSDELSSTLAAISTVAREEFKAASAVLAPLNITIISSSDVITPGSNNRHLQTAVPLATTVEAVSSMFHYMGWDYVSVIYDLESDNVERLNFYKKFASDKGVCSATELVVSSYDTVEIDFIVNQLIEAKQRGSNVVIMWTSKITTSVLLDGFRRAQSAGVISVDDFTVICNGEWIKDLNSFDGMVNYTVGITTAKPEKGNVNDFEEYYKKIQPHMNMRNPWFSELWYMNEECLLSSCTADESALKLHSLSSSTSDTIQSILAVSAGLARLRNDVCHPDRGLCPNLQHQPHLREIFHKYMLETASSRLDVKDEMFTFDKEGFGNIALSIVSLRRGPGNALTHQKIGTFQNHQTEVFGSVIRSVSGEDQSVDDIESTCMQDCSGCVRKNTDFVVLDSVDDLYVAAALGVHDSNPANPLICSPRVPSPSIQLVEAFLWAIDQINISPQLLPGIKFGAVVLDVCNSKERAARDVSNFLSGSLPAIAGKSSPKIDSVMGLVSTQSDDVVESIVDVTSPFKMLTMGTDTSSTVFNDVSKHSSLLRTSLPNDVTASGLIDLLKQLRWNYVSVIYSASDLRKTNLFSSLKEEANVRGVELATVETVPQIHSDEIMQDILKRISSKKDQGARVVLLLLSTDHMTAFFSAVSRKKFLSEQEDPNDFLWIGLDNLEVFHRYPDAALGAIMLRHSRNTIMPFKQYFESLHLKNNSRNPWFKEFWQQELGCRGASCYRKNSLSTAPFVQDSSVVGIVNSVLGIAVGLEALRVKFCPGIKAGICVNLKKDPAFRELLLNATRTASFMGVEGKLFKFTKHNYAASTLEVLNFAKVANNARAFVKVGEFSPDEGLSLNHSNIRAYSKYGQEISIYDIQSQCLDDLTCQNISDRREVTIMEIVPKQEFAISAVMPIHQRGKSFFDCGMLKDERMFQNLVAISYAIKKVNSNDTLLPGVNLGALVFDYCDRKQKAEEQLYGFFSKDDRSQTTKARITPRSVIATLTYGECIATDLNPILEASDVVQIAAPADQMDSGDDNNIIYTVPSFMTQIRVLLSIISKFQWKYVNLMYSNTDYGRSGYYHFSQGAKEAGICLASIIMVDKGSTPTLMSYKLQDELEKDGSNIVVLLIDDQQLINDTFEAAKRSLLLDKYLWVGSNINPAEAGFDLPSTDDSNGNIISIKVENKEVEGFAKFLSEMTPRKHEPIPDSWFDELWQNRFKCRLQNGQNTEVQYTKLCTGDERLIPGDMAQDKNVYHTTKVIEALAVSLHNFLLARCPRGLATTSIDDCGQNARKDLQREIKKIMSGNDPDCEECGPLGTMFGYEVVQLNNQEDGSASSTVIGIWKDRMLSIDEDQAMRIRGTISACRKDCTKCSNQLGTPENLSSLKRLTYENFKEVWGITVTALSVLGMVLVIICTIYFLMLFPVTVGTTVLGYMILFGLFLLYCVNFAFVIAPTEGTCGVRRFGLGLAYAIIFAGMLVKVMNTWRIMGCNGSRMLNDGTRLSSPAGLLVIAVGLVIIQIVLSAAWLILMPPKIGTYEMVWRCAPPTTFEEGLVVSLVYVMLLLAITTLFSILTWQCQDNNKESRWILVCSILVAVIWMTWTIMSTQITPHRRDLTIAAANLINATIIMVCLYLRKVYLYSKLSRQAKDQDLKAHLQPSNYSHSLYGSSHKSGPFSNLTPVFYGSQASLSGSKRQFNGPSSRLELINCPEDNKSDSSGSVQVQAADLYPLDMYDGGSQFQPVSSLFGSNHTLVLDDTITFAR